MQKQSLLRKIVSLGGTAEILPETAQKHERLVGRLGNYSVSMQWCDFFTITKDGTEYDHGSDYNPSGAIFLYRLKDLERYAQA